jgi:hypothetical protein
MNVEKLKIDDLRRYSLKKRKALLFSVVDKKFKDVVS